jgi:hypothetical protein
MRYELRLMDKRRRSGLLQAHPAQNLSFNDMLDYLRSIPWTTSCTSSCSGHERPPAPANWKSSSTR